MYFFNVAYTLDTPVNDKFMQPDICNTLFQISAELRHVPGGCNHDGCGLGKTIMLLCLILLDKRIHRPRSARKAGVQRIQGSFFITLPGLRQEAGSEFRKFTAKSFKIIMYERDTTLEQLAEANIVLLTFSQVLVATGEGKKD